MARRAVIKENRGERALLHPLETTEAALAGGPCTALILVGGAYSAALRIGAGTFAPAFFKKPLFHATSPLAHELSL